MTAFACSLNVSCPEQTINLEIKNSQLWCLEFDSSTTMAFFMHEIRNHTPFSPTKSLPVKIQIVPYEITHHEEKIFFYQQRYHATENNEVITVNDFIGQNYLQQRLIGQSILRERRNDPITHLSTGEFKIACLLKAFQPESKIIFLEELFAGLDSTNRSMVIQFLRSLCQATKTCIIVTTTRPNESSLFDHYLKIYLPNQQYPREKHAIPLKPLFQNKPLQNFQYAFKLTNINVRYNERIILNNISWAVKKGEKWALRGHNGSGKSTLLSLINADHPQSYANDILIFDQPRKYGRNIWEIKDNIAYFSHEYFRYMDKSKTITETALQIINSNPYKPAKEPNTVTEKLTLLMQYFDLPVHKLNSPIYLLAPVHQRMAVLMGVLLKNAPLLILDEPYHYFDSTIVTKFNFLIDSHLNDTTLIFVSHNNNDFPSCIDHHFYLS